MSGQRQDGVRLAELVAALCLGIDLGFGQPMEHVLRQCLIALRIAEPVGLDDEERGGAYWTALLVNVGCHTDAHEQAKWFGDDIALKADKYAYEMHSLRGAVAGVRRIGAGHAAAAPFPDRARVRHLGPPGHRRDDRPARRPGPRAGRAAELAGDVLDALGASYEQWDGQGLARGAARASGAGRRPGSPSSPSSSRWPTARAAPPRRACWPRARSGKQFDPELSTLVCEHADDAVRRSRRRADLGRR